MGCNCGGSKRAERLRAAREARKATAPVKGPRAPGYTHTGTAKPDARP